MLDRDLTTTVSHAALLALPGVVTVYLSFNAGGFFPNTPAFVAVLLAGVLVVRTLLADEPFAGLSRSLLLASGALALFAVWTLASAIWSDALGRSLIETSRVLLYLLALLLFGSMARTSHALRWMVRGVALGIVIVCTVALVTRVLPDVWPIAPNLAENRLSYPLTYWNALGLLCSLGLIFCFHLTCSLGEPRIVRVVAAGALPLLGTTLLFTYSRGGLAASAIGLVVYIVVGRPRGLVSGLLAAGPPTAVAVIAAYDADLLAGLSPTTSAATAQGHDVALVVAICTAVAISIRALLLLLDVRLARFHLPHHLRRPLLASLGAAVIVGAVVGAAALDAPSRVSDQYDRFTQGFDEETQRDFRQRLTDPGNRARLEQWKVSIRDFDREPVRGTGAGTYPLSWVEDRPASSNIDDAHSLYVEVLGELGIVGMALLALCLGVILVVLGARVRESDRTVYVAVLAAAIAWAFHAGVDWDWEMPAVTFWLLALGGAALASPPQRSPAIARPSMGLRAPVAVGVAAVAVLPMLVFVSQARLDESVEQFGAGDCGAASASARSSISALGSRAEPYQVLAYCKLRGGRPLQAVRDTRDAIERDPHNWEYQFDLAVARASAGLDPRPAARRALRLNPLESATKDALERFRTDNPRVWKRQAELLVEDAFL